GGRADGHDGFVVVTGAAVGGAGATAGALGALGAGLGAVVGAAVAPEVVRRGVLPAVAAEAAVVGAGGAAPDAG
ncbi:MAG: hypothetical protein ACXVJZ_13330, partial [Acidimicrobiia bacterium]